MSEREARVLIFHDQPESFLDDLKVRFPGLPIEACARAEDLEAALARLKPTVAFSVKCEGLPGPVQARLLDCPSLEWIQVGGAGVDHLAKAAGRPLIVTNGAGVLSPFMAETVMGAILLLNYGFHRYLRQQAARQWQQNPWLPLAGKRLLVIGLGNIGQRVAAHSRSFGMTVTGLRARPAPLDGFDEVYGLNQLHEALAGADVVSLHVPLTPDTRGLIDSAALAVMKPGAILVNTSRGGVVEEAALLAALREKRIAGAHMDVFETEPLPAKSPLWALDNLVITPHWSDSVADWPARFASFFGDNLERWLAGRPLENVVDLARGY
ncbi:MAG: D-2-hydroxyacid dehydrogenase [Pseudomonadota bacterium]